MSKATSIRGKRYEENFRNGFIRKNAERMVGGKFVDIREIFGKRNDGTRNNTIGDIDAYFVSETDCKLADLLPDTKRLGDPNFDIMAGDNVFFELTTQSGDDLGKIPYKHIEKKVQFHHKLIIGEAFEFGIKGRHVLVLGFNGADNVGVAAAFKSACDTYSIYGMSVYMASDIVDQWDLELRLAEALEREKQLRIKFGLPPHEEIGTDIDDVDDNSS